MSSRSFRLETRSRARDEIKRIMQTVEKVRKWEKKWIDLGLSNSLKVYKWVPVRDENKDDDSDDDNKENEPVALTETNMEQNGNGEPDLPDIKLHVVAQPMAVDSNSLMASQAPPDMLLGSEESEKKCSPIPAEPSALLDASETTQGSEKTNDGGETVKEGDPVDKTPPQSSQEALPEDVKTEAMETDDALAGNGEEKDGDDVGNGTSTSQQPPTDHEVVAEGEADANGNTVSQPCETVEQPLSEQDKEKVEGEGTVQGESSESAVVVEGVPPEEGAEAREEVVKEPGEETVEQSQEQQEVQHVENQGEKRELDKSLESSSFTPSPKRSRSQSPH